MSDKQTSVKEEGVQCVCVYVCLISYMSVLKGTQACRLIAGQVPVYILRPKMLVQLYFASSLGAFLRPSALSDTSGILVYQSSLCLKRGPCYTKVITLIPTLLVSSL